MPFEKSGFRKPFLTKGQLYQAARPYLETFRIHARPDQKILGFAGLVGAGRSEIMQTLFGFLPKTNGNATFDGRPWVFGDTHFAVKSGLIYLPEERKLLRAIIGAEEGKRE